MARPRPGDPDYNDYARLFNDITHAPGDWMMLSQRHAIADHLWDLGYRKPAVKVAMVDVADPAAGPTRAELDAGTPIAGVEVAQVVDHRESDGCCGRSDSHRAHWWGPNSVFYCRGGSP